MKKSRDNPVDKARAAPRCHARSKRTGLPCGAPAVSGLHHRVTGDLRLLGFEAAFALALGADAKVGYPLATAIRHLFLHIKDSILPDGGSICDVRNEKPAGVNRRVVLLSTSFRYLDLVVAELEPLVALVFEPLV